MIARRPHESGDSGSSVIHSFHWIPAFVGTTRLKIGKTNNSHAIKTRLLRSPRRQPQRDRS